MASSESFFSKRLQKYAPLLASGMVSYHTVASNAKHFILWVTIIIFTVRVHTKLLFSLISYYYMLKFVILEYE